MPIRSTLTRGPGPQLERVTIARVRESDSERRARWAALIEEAEERAGWADFVREMRTHFDKFGRFTPGQEEALQRMIDRADGF